MIPPTAGDLMLEAELGRWAKMPSLVQVATDSQSLAAMACRYVLAQVIDLATGMNLD